MISPVRTSGEMRAVTIRGKKTLEITRQPTPVPVGDQIRVRVHAAGLNRADLWQLSGGYPAPPGSPADIPGLEFAGVVDALGPSATRWRLGDRVYGIVGGGAQAEYVLVPASHCAAIPPNLEFTSAGGVAETFVTASDALFTQGALRDGETVVIHAIGSGVGTSALQLAKSRGCTVFGTARGATKFERAQALGLDRGIALTASTDPETLRQQVMEIKNQANLVLDLVGGAYLGVDVLVAGPWARIVMLSTIGGDICPLNLREFMNKWLTLRGSVLRGRSVEAKAAAVALFEQRVGPLLAAGTVRPIIERVFPWSQIQAAYELLASDATFGKIVLEIDA